MTHAELGSTALWLMLLLGAYHGINPGMGWLFAVALGMQERKGSCSGESARPHRAWPRVGHRQRGAGGCVSRHGAAARGHPLSRRRASVRPWNLLPGAASPPALGPMQVGFRDLTLWSFLMASAHGAGLMVLPVLLGSSTVEAAEQMAGHHHMSAAASPLAATACHRRPYDGLSCGHRSGRVGGLSQARSRDSPQGMVQPRLGLGRCARGHRRGHPDDLASQILTTE